VLKYGTLCKNLACKRGKDSRNSVGIIITAALAFASFRLEVKVWS
jgi:hypothetical protein